MDPRRMPMTEGGRWFVQGWRLFTSDLEMWLIQTLAWFVAILALYLIPKLGVLIILTLTPAFYAGFIYGAKKVDQGRDLKFRHIFQGLIDNNKRLPLLILGLTAALIGLVLMALGVDLGGDLSGLNVRSDRPPVAGGSGAVSPIIVFITQAAFFAFLSNLVFIYACPLVMFTNAKPFVALRSSLIACLDNARPLLLFSLIYFGLGLFASILVGLPFLIVFPVTFCALYASYKSIYEHTPAQPIQDSTPRPQKRRKTRARSR
jgi:hypothetical protein